MTTEPEFVTSPDGTPIAYRRVGAGPPVVALHGGLGSSVSWLRVAERLADRFEFFLVDRRGRGASGDGTPPHSLAKEVEDARTVLQAAGRGAALMGHSYGGSVALELARVAAPEEIGRLALYEPGVRATELIPSARIDQLEALVEQGLPERALEVAMEQLHAAGLVRSDRPGGARRAGAGLVEIAWTVPRELRALSLVGSDLTRYAVIGVPTLLMIGTTTPAPGQRNCEALAQVLPEVRLARLDGQGHVAHNSDPDQVAAVVGAFLR